MKVKNSSNMHLAKKRSEYKIQYKEPAMNIPYVDEEDDTHEYSMLGGTHSQKEDASDGRCENSAKNVSNRIKPI